LGPVGAQKGPCEGGGGGKFKTSDDSERGLEFKRKDETTKGGEQKKKMAFRKDPPKWSKRYGNGLSQGLEERGKRLAY